MTPRRLLVGLAAGAIVFGLLVSSGPGRSRATGGPPVAAQKRQPLLPLAPPGAFAVARAFIVAYVAVIYHRLSPTQLPHASPYLRHQVAGLRADPPAAVRAVADPRLRSLRVIALPGRRARAQVVIEDGPAVYGVVLELRRRPAGWTITGLSETS